jgi:hypothetical protein
MPLSESVRQAATMKVGISTYVATAALAVMAGTLVIYTFVTASFQESWLFHALIFLGLLLLVLSIVLGGMASGQITDAIADDNWDPSSTKEGPLGGRFSQQAMLTVVGLVVVTVATIIGVGSASEMSRTDERIDDLVGDVHILQDKVEATQRQAERLAREVQRLQRRASR